MLFEDPEQTRLALTAQVSTACTALADLLEVNPTDVVEDGATKEQWIGHMRELIAACAYLHAGADLFFDMISYFIAQIPLEGRSEDLVTLITEWQNKRGLMSVVHAGKKGGTKVRDTHDEFCAFTHCLSTAGC